MLSKSKRYTITYLERACQRCFRIQAVATELRTGKEVMPKDHKLNVELSVYELYLLEEALQDHAGDLQHDAQVAKAETDRAELLALRASEASELRTKLDAI